jgi:hypothetical protein
MLDLFLGLRRAVKGRAQNKVDIVGSRPPFRYFWYLQLCNRYGDVNPGVYPCLGPIL